MVHAEVAHWAKRLTIVSRASTEAPKQNAGLAHR